VATLTAALDQATDQSPVNAALGRVWLQLAESRTDRPEAAGRALEALERAASALTATSDTKALYGRALASSGQLDAAEQLFQQAIERYPIAPSAFRQLGLVADELGHAAVARTAFMQYLSLAPTDPDAASFAARIGALSLKLNEAAAALPWLQRALAAKPDDLPVLTAMAEAQLLAGDAPSARLTLTHALALQPANRELQRLDRRIKKAEG